MKHCVALLVVVYLVYAAAQNESKGEGSTAKPDNPPEPTASQTTLTPTKPPAPNDTSPCTVGVAADVLPQLDDQFEAHVEATFGHKGYTMDVVEYYDWTNNRGAVITWKDGNQERILYDFPNNVFFVIKGNQCDRTNVVNSTNKGFNFFNFTSTPKGGHIQGIADLFNLGTKYKTTYGGKTEARGIPVEKWSSCLTWERYQATFEADFYFTQADYPSPAGKRQIPVRVTVTGKGLPSGDNPGYTINHTYEFISYRPGPIQDPTVFEVPRGYVCSGNHSKKRPELPDSFSAGVEVVDMLANYTTIKMESYNFAGNLTRFDYRPTQGEKVDERYKDRPLRVIHDYSSGVEYVIDAIRENCWMQPIPTNSLDGITSDDGHAKMKHGSQLFVYQGKRKVRDIPCDVWAAKAINYTGPGINTTVEVYFMQKQNNWHAEVLDKNEEAPFVGLWMRSIDAEGSVVGERSSHTFSYYHGEPDIDRFDVSTCYLKPDLMTHVLFRLNGSYQDLVVNKLMYLKTAVRKHVAITAHVEQIRIQNIYFDMTNSKYVDVWFTILEKSDIKGSVKHPVPGVSMETAYVLLKQTIDGYGLNITYHPLEEDERTVSSVAGSLTTSKEAYDPRDIPQPVQTSSRSGYSPGSMAALGICMLIIGLAAGLGGAYYLWRRTSPTPGGVPYRIHT